MVSSKPEGSTLRMTELDDVVDAALREDLGPELGGTDITTRFVVAADLMGEARVIAKKAGVLSGSDAAARVFEKVNPPCEYVALKPDGTRLQPGDEVARIVGSLASILTAERTALNFLQRLSGIATSPASTSMRWPHIRPSPCSTLARRRRDYVFSSERQCERAAGTTIETACGTRSSSRTTMWRPRAE